MPIRKIGVEEELLLVDPDTRRLASVAEAAVRANESDAEVERELFLQMIETSTPPCDRADDLDTSIRAGRRALGSAAAAAGARAVAVAAPVLDDEDGHFTGKPRYRKIAAEYGEMARQGLVSAMHMHVDVTDDEEAVRVVDGIRPWLPLLVALSANSPFYRGRDTGHASWRSQVWSRWPTGGPREPFGDLTTYRAVGEAMTGWGGAIDEAMLYFDVRLSTTYPTVEIRVADVCTDVEDACLVALLARALVDRSAQRLESGDDPPSPPWRADLLRVATWRAARFGLAAGLVHPVEQRLAPSHEVFAAAIEHARASLEEHGDLEQVTTSFERLRARGGGATRQRAVHEATGSLEKVVDDLADRTEDSWTV